MPGNQPAHHTVLQGGNTPRETLLIPEQSLTRLRQLSERIHKAGSSPLGSPPSGEFRTFFTQTRSQCAIFTCSSSQKHKTLQKSGDPSSPAHTVLTRSRSLPSARVDLFLSRGTKADRPENTEDQITYSNQTAHGSLPAPGPTIISSDVSVSQEAPVSSLRRLAEEHQSYLSPGAPDVKGPTRHDSESSKTSDVRNRGSTHRPGSSTPGRPLASRSGRTSPSGRSLRDY